MTHRMSKTGFIALALSLSLSSGISFAETLNPEQVNPHENAPRKRITLKQKEAAAQARKERMKEIKARKAAKTGQHDGTTGGNAPAGQSNDTVNK